MQFYTYMTTGTTITNFIIYNVFSLTSIKFLDQFLNFINSKFRKDWNNKKIVEKDGRLINTNKELWFQMHSIVNFIIVYLSYGDVYDCLVNPNYSIKPCSNLLAGSFALMLHVYHSYSYRLTHIDRLHHGISVFLATPLCILYQTKGISMYYFFGTGLPGGIDYLLLSLVKQGKLGALNEKKINSYLNTFIRIPGLVLTSYLIWKDSINNPSKILTYSNKLLSLLVFLNGTIFGKMAIENYKERFIENKIDK